MTTLSTVPEINRPTSGLAAEQPFASSAAMTPMLRQFYELKSRCGDAILFFRMGDFYEIFGKDAEEVAPLLELVLTSRERGDQQRIPFCGVPHHSARNYWLKLLKKGYKVALADQVEDPAEAKGLVKRDIVRILTPGCIDDLDGLEKDAPNYVLAVYEDPSRSKWAAAVADLSTGELRLGSMSGHNEILSLVEQFRPKEILARKFCHPELTSLLAPYLAENRLLIEALPEAALRDENDQKSVLTEIFGKTELSSQPCGAVVGGEALLAALIGHFRTLHASVSQFLAVRPLTEAGTMILNESAIRDLEIFETARRRQADGSLFRELNRTLSPMGARLLRYSLAHPLLDKQQIRGRHGAVRSLLQHGEAELTSLREMIKHMPDIERLATRIFAGSATPVELAKVQQALERAKWLVDNVTGDRGEKLSGDLFKAIATGLKFFKRPLAILKSALQESPRALGAADGVFAPAYDAELDKLLSLAKSGESQVEAYQEQLKSRTNINSLKIKNHKTFGLLIEITRANQDKVPTDFIRRQTMVNCERFVTVELEELGETLASAMELAIKREKELYDGLLLELSKFRMDLRSIAHALASFDLLQSFAWQALRCGYCEPKLVDDDKLELQGSRHPVVERYVGRHAFAPNDVVLTPSKKHLLITGPNMAGKSTVMRQTAICALMNQIGSFVPAMSARMPVFDRIFTRVGAADDLSRGQSTFMVEMSEAAQILRQATQKSLVILDEVGRGTSTQDGLAIASAILEDLAKRLRCYSLFATHYHEMIPLAESLSTVRVMQTEVIEQNNKIIFTHRLKDGASGSSYGIEVARIAGLPEGVINKASQYLAAALAAEQVPHAYQESSPTTEAVPLKGASRHGPAPLEANGLKSTSDVRNPKHQPNQKLVEIGERLLNVNINRLTPIQALNFLNEIQIKLTHKGALTLFPEEPC